MGEHSETVQFPTVSTPTLLDLQAFASIGNHPLLKLVVELILERSEGGIDPRDENFVHWHTGPGAWTSAIAKFLGLGGESLQGPSSVSSSGDDSEGGEGR